MRDEIEREEKAWAVERAREQQQNVKWILYMVIDESYREK